MYKIIRCVGNKNGKGCGKYFASQATWQASCKFCGKNINLNSKGLSINVIKRIGTGKEAKEFVKELNKEFIKSKELNTNNSW